MAKMFFSQVGLYSVLWPVCKDSEGASPICQGRFFVFFLLMFLSAFIIHFDSISPRKLSLLIEICQGIKTFTFIPVCWCIYKNFHFQCRLEIFTVWKFSLLLTSPICKVPQFHKTHHTQCLSSTVFDEDWGSSLSGTLTRVVKAERLYRGKRLKG